MASSSWRRAWWLCSTIAALCCWWARCGGFSTALGIVRAMATGSARANRPCRPGADFAYVERFIARGSQCQRNYKPRPSVKAGASDIVYSNAGSRACGNYLRESIGSARAGPGRPAGGDKTKMGFMMGAQGRGLEEDIWGAGQGVGQSTICR